MRVAVVHVTAESVSGPFTELVSKNFEQARGESTTIEHLYVPHLRRATDTVFAYPTLLNKVDVVHLAVEAERRGCDAVVVLCSGDTGVAEARTVVSIPVVGPLEAAILLACSYGYRFGIATVADPTWVSYTRMVADTQGLGARCAGIRRITTPSATAFTAGFGPGMAAVVADVAEAAAALADEGAESVVVASAGLSAMATASGLAEVPPGVPVFDCLTVGLKAAELKVQLRQRLGVPAVGRSGWFARFEEAEMERVDRLFGAAASPAAR